MIFLSAVRTTTTATTARHDQDDEDRKYTVRNQASNTFLANMIDLDSLDGIDILDNTQNNEAAAAAATQTTTVQAARTLAADDYNNSPTTIDTGTTTNNPTIITSTTTPTSTTTQSIRQPSSSSSASSFSSMPMKRENSNLLTCLLITANVGTIFEEATLLELWFQQLKSYLTKIRPQLVAIHCQEVGGKNYQTSMKHVNNFTDKIIGDESIIKDYGRVRIFLDENFENLEKFTALGSLYLVHDSVENVKLYNFETAQYESLEGRKVCTDKADNQQSADHVEKVKFPQELFPECRWSRKGFMRTRWLFNDSQPIDLVNIHLFHDASNLVAMETTPSPYAQNRQRALEFALNKLATPLNTQANNDQQNKDKSQDSTADHTTTTSSSPATNHINHHHHQDGQQEVPLFIFGDFNFRLNTNKVIQRITEGVSPVIKKSASNEVLEFIYHKRNVNELHAGDGGKGMTVEDEKTMGRVGGESMRNDDGNSNYIEGGGVVMTIGKKLFDCENLDETFRATENTEWLQELDNELDSFREQLLEFKISFSPSYPFKEDTSGAYSYMKTRCPAWCDRILFNAAGGNLIHSKESTVSPLLGSERIVALQNQGDVIYRLMGSSVPMGDHKPVLLYCQLNFAPQNVAVCPPDNLIESTAM